MKKILVIAEKPALGQAIADAVEGAEEKRNGIIQKGDYTIIWAFGHLLTLKAPEDYEEKYKKWALEDLPLYFPDWGMKVKKDCGERVEQIGKLLKEADMVIHAGDTDEEGQLLIDELLRWHGYKGEVKRLDTANTSAGALKKALGELKDNRTEEKNGRAAYARSIGDMLFGINLTRYYTVLNKSLLSIGRVQTPTLGLVVQRDEMIEGHKKQKYYKLELAVQLDGKSIETEYIPPEDAEYLTDGMALQEDSLERLMEKIMAGTRKLEGVSIKKERSSENPPLPFNLMKLNTYCAKKWGMNPDEVMSVTQSLRDNYKAITYNRSDCQYLSEEHFKEAPGVLKACLKNLGIQEEGIDPARKSRCFNDANITAHFAIIPTDSVVDPEKLTEKERRVYKAICSYYIIQFMEPAEKEKTVLFKEYSGGGTIAASASRYTAAGYRTFLKENEDEEKKEPPLCFVSEGNYDAEIVNCHIKENETKPPARYTQDSLFSDMGSIAKYVKDPEMKKVLLEKDKEKKGENGSIGTVATRAIIIKRLLEVGYLEEKTEKKKPYLVSTKKGRAFYHMLPENIKGADITAKWWLLQEEIKAGKAEPEDLARNVLKEVEKVIKSGGGSLPEDLLGNGKQKLCSCPKCGGGMTEGKYGFYCMDKCGFSLGTIRGKKLTGEQAAALCSGKKVLLSGVKKKDGSGSYSVYAIPDGVESYEYEKDGETKSGWRLKMNFELPKRKKRT